LVFSLLAADRRARDAGADAFLGKPLSSEKLVETVRTLLRGRSGSSISGEGYPELKRMP
jgi:DNA-binding response OmpR family regulator